MVSRGVQAEAESNTLWLYGPFVKTPLPEEFGISEISAERVRDEVAQLDGGDLLVRLNSGGGNYAVSNAVGAILRDYCEARNAKLTMRGDGIVGSAAAFLFQRGNVRELDELASLVYHEIRIPDLVTKTVAAELLEELTNADNTVARMVEKRTKTSMKDYLAKIAGKEWTLESDMALELGHTDRVLDAAPKTDEDAEASLTGAQREASATVWSRFNLTAGIAAQNLRRKARE